MICREIKCTIIFQPACFLALKLTKTKTNLTLSATFVWNVCSYIEIKRVYIYIFKSDFHCSWEHKGWNLVTVQVLTRMFNGWTEKKVFCLLPDINLTLDPINIVCSSFRLENKTIQKNLEAFQCYTVLRRQDICQIIINVYSEDQCMDLA